MSSIMELKSYIFDNKTKKRPKRADSYSSSESYHRHRGYSRDKHRRKSRKRNQPPSDSEDDPEDSPSFSFSKSMKRQNTHHQGYQEEAQFAHKKRDGNKMRSFSM